MNFAEAINQQQNQQIEIIQYRKIASRALNDIIKGIATFHQEGIMHRNISPQTIYLDNEDLKEARFYIGDQGMAKEEVNLSTGTQYCTSYLFHPPESVENITMKSDIYQFGLVALYILNKGQPLFPVCFLDSEEIEEKLKPDYIYTKFIENKLEYNPQLIQLISQCLKQNPKERPETNEVQKQVSQMYRDLRIRFAQKPLLTQN